MNFVVIWGLFLGLSATAIPLAFSIGLTPLLFGLFTGKFPLTVIFQSIVSTNESFTLLALPFFVLAGEIMGVGGIGKRITQFAYALLGWVPGGLAIISVVASMIFGALIVFFLIVEPHGLARLWSVAKEKLRLWPFPH